jgi:hypothetical protein
MEVQVKLFGGKVEEVEKNLLFFLPLATKPRTFSFSFHWPPNQEPSLPPSIGHQALDLPSPSFSFFLKGGLRCLGGFFFSSFGEITSNSIWRNTSSYKFLEEEKQDQLSSGEDEGE